MSNNLPRIEPILYNYAIQNSEKFRQDISHALSHVIMPRVEQLLSSQGLFPQTHEGRMAVVSLVKTLPGDMAQKLKDQFQQIPTHNIVTQDGVNIDGLSEIPDYLLREFLERISDKSIISEVLQEKSTQVDIHNVLAPLSQEANRYFRSKTHTLDIRDGTNWKDIFPSNLGMLDDFTKPFDPRETSVQSLDNLREKNGLFLDSLYNKVLLEWATKQGISNSFKHAFHLADEPSIKNGKTKGRTIEFVHFLPIDIFIFHLIITYLSRGEFALASESDMGKVVSDLSKQNDLDTYATIISEEIQSRVIPFIGQISEKEPFIKWFKGKINKKTILNILTLLKGAHRNRSDTNMLNPYWLAKIDSTLTLRKVTLVEYVSEF